jgi:hypothetical protein
MSRPAATTDRLRHDIDSGHTGDKVSNSDPAAAPLGTDDEAAGNPASSEEIEKARQSELRDKPAKGSHDPSHSSGILIYMVAVGIFAAAIVGLALSLL